MPHVSGKSKKAERNAALPLPLPPLLLLLSRPQSSNEADADFAAVAVACCVVVNLFVTVPISVLFEIRKNLSVVVVERELCTVLSGLGVD